MMITEAYASPDELGMYYGRTKLGGADFPFNFQLTTLDSNCQGQCVNELVTDWMNVKPDWAAANWVVSYARSEAVSEYRIHSSGNIGHSGKLEPFSARTIPLHFAARVTYTSSKFFFFCYSLVTMTDLV